MGLACVRVSPQEEVGDEDVLVDRRPMERPAAHTDLDGLPLLRRSGLEPWEPGEWHREEPTINERDVEQHVVAGDVLSQRSRG